MSSLKGNEWLPGASDDEASESGYDSEAAEKPRTIRAAKRRRVSTPEEDVDYESDNDTEARDHHRENPKSRSTYDQTHDDAYARDEGIRGIGLVAEQKSPRRLKAPEIEPHQLAKPNKSTASKTGVIYLSRIPPFMKPQTLKHLLEPYGEIGRIFLTPEDPVSHTKRVRSGGNKKRSFIDGWVEFQRKKDAKIVAETLNAQIIGGKKGGWYHDDIWNIKYLTGFKWLHLTEQIANENAERAARLRAEISQTTKENKRFVANVEQSKILGGIMAKKKQRTYEQDLEKAAPKLAGTPQALEGYIKQPRSSFRQNEVRTKSGRGNGNEAAVQRVLSKIF